MAQITSHGGRALVWTIALTAAALPGCLDQDFDPIAHLGSGLEVEAGSGLTQLEDSGTASVHPFNGSVDATSPSGADASNAGTPSAVVPAAPIDFWQVECGAFTSRLVPIENTGTGPLTVHASTTGTEFTVAPGTLTILPTGSETLTVTANVPTSATAGSPLSGALTLETNDPSTPTIDVDLAVTPLGATLTFGPEGIPDPSEADFGPHLIGENAQEYAEIRLNLLNSGNEAVVVSFGSPSDPQFALSAAWVGPLTAVSEAGAATLDPRDELPDGIELSAVFTPTTDSESTATSPITVEGAVCGNSVTELLYSGQGTPGGLSGWPTPPLLFPRAPSGPLTCATPTAVATGLLLHNPGATDVTLTSLVFDTPGYSSSTPAGTKIPAGGQLDVAITGPTPPAMPGPASYEAGLVVTTDAPGDVPHPIQIIVKCL